MPKDPVDRRIERTRKAVLDAFFDLVQEVRYNDITVAHIVARAGVSRSAFFARFAGKDALLATSIAGPFSVLANTWLTGESCCSSQDLAMALRRVSVAALDEMTVPNDNARR